MAETPGGVKVDPQFEAVWRDVLTHGHRHRLSFLPGTMRCTGCNVAMKGIGGRIVQATSGIRQSRKNPNFCNLCDDALPQGGAEVDIAVLFADVRGSTGLAEKLGPSAFAALLNRFYDAASQALLPLNAMIDKMVGDEVVGIFFPNTGPGYRANAVHAAVRLLRLVGFGSPAGGWIPVGIGVNAGVAFAGRIGAGEVHDFTALGDTVNTGARMQAQALAGEIVMSQELYLEVEQEYPGLERRTFDIRGREAKLDGRVLKL
jgi:class 3 adenylate cyclase